MRTAMRWRRIPGGLPFLLIAAVLTLAGCGSDDDTAGTTVPVTTVGPAITTAVPSTTTGAPVATKEPATTSPATTSPATTSPATTSPVTTVPGQFSVTVGVDSGPDRREQIGVGTTVRLTLVNPDSDDEFHVHGVDLGDDEVVPQGQPKTFVFVAEESGEIEVESHATDSVLIVIEVTA